MINFLSFGEVLFDIFPSGEKRLGGAPLNFTYHMSKLRNKGEIISAVGKDTLGDEALLEIQKRSLSTKYIVKNNYETGTSTIKNKEGEASYAFNYPSSWDYISLPSIDEKEVDLLYFGTLALRNEFSYLTWEKLTKNINAKEYLFDVNFRNGFYNKKLLEKCLRKTSILRMNENECKILLSLFYGSGSKLSLQKLYKDYNLKLILITLGEIGSVLYDGKRWAKCDSKKVKVVSTVGAGDAFLAAFISSYLKDGDEIKALIDGRELSSYVLSYESATPEYNDSIKSYFKV